MKKFLTIERTKILGNAFIDSQFNYAPLPRMFCRKTLYSKIIYESNDIYGNQFLQSNTVTVHKKHVRFLMTEIKKTKP